MGRIGDRDEARDDRRRRNESLARAGGGFLALRKSSGPAGSGRGIRGASRDSHLRVEILDAEILERGRPGSGGGLGDRARGLGACARGRNSNVVRCWLERRGACKLDGGEARGLGGDGADAGVAKDARGSRRDTRDERASRDGRTHATGVGRITRPQRAAAPPRGATTTKGGLLKSLGAGPRTHPSSRRRRPGRGARGRHARARRRARRSRRRGRGRRAQRGWR